MHFVPRRGPGPVAFLALAILACAGEQLPEGPTQVSPVATFTFAQAAETLFVGASETLRATPRSSSGQIILDYPVTYTVVGTNTSATVTPATWTVGVDATAPGTLTIRATCDDKEATVGVIVVPRPTSMTVSPTSLELTGDQSASIAATVYDAASNVISAAPRSFASGNSIVASVNGSGVVTGHAAGSTTITITSDTVVRTVPVTVTAAPAPVFDIAVRWVGTAPGTALTDAVSEAAARWQAVLTAEIPDVFVSSAANQCFAGMPALSETIDDILIFIQLDSVDGPGAAVAVGGPCILRSSSELPAIGRITVDEADVASLSTRGLLGDVITHEMGHTLGIGTLWNWGSRTLIVGSGTSDPTFTGVRARDASAVLGFTASSTDNVPVESTGGTGTAEGHWRESTFDKELMTGFVDDGTNALSRVSAASLADLGYTVDESQAEAFSSAAALRMEGEPGTSFRIEERLERPRFVVDEKGRVTPLP